MTNQPEATSFVAWYRELHGRDPFPWQAAYAERVVTEGWCPIKAPTGLGKTDVITIAVWAMAHGRAPRRIWYISPRRVLVDYGAELADRIAALLAAPTGPASAWVAERLDAMAALRTGNGPLEVMRYRGGLESFGAMPIDPAQPAVICSTIDQWASRVLFAGYGSGFAARVEAALAWIDSLVIFDEPHLFAAVETMAEDVRIAQAHVPLVVERGPVMVPMTATMDEREAFELTEADLAHSLVRRRIHAAKPLRLVEVVPATDDDEALRALTAASVAATTLELLEAAHRTARGHVAAIAFVNQPSTATATAAALEGTTVAGVEVEVVTLHGRLRPFEASRIAARLVDPVDGIASGSAMTRERPLVVVATQTLEVGADLDTALLVTEACGASSLVQRLGRCNRLGDHGAVASAAFVYVDRTKVATKREPTWSIYGAEPVEVMATLRSHELMGSVDASPASLARIIVPTIERPHRPVVSATLLDRMARTPGVAFDVSTFWSDEDTDVQVLWRAAIPEPDEQLGVPPQVAEMVSLPRWELGRFLDRKGVRAWRYDWQTRELEPVTKPRGSLFVIDAASGGYDPVRGFDPDERALVLDVSPLASGRLTLDSRTVAGLAPGVPAGLAEAVAEGSVGLDELRAALLVAEHSFAVDEWAAFVASLEVVVAIDERQPFAAPRRRAKGRLQLDPANDAWDDWTFQPQTMELDGHLASVGETAGRIAAAMDLPPELVEACRLAGDLHDIGKAEPRFQAWLHGGWWDGEGPALAKSDLGPEERMAARDLSGFPKGGRHETISMRMGEVSGEDDLVLHAVASHHGYGVPWLPPVEDVLGGEATWNGVTVDADFSSPEWEQVERFDRLMAAYGPHGLALLEAVVRMADWRVSAQAAAPPRRERARAGRR